MPKSMTSFGRCRATVSGKDITAEIRSVNSRFFDCTVKISKMYGFLEEKIKAYVQAKGISRGKVEIYVGVDLLEQEGVEILLDAPYAASYIAALRRLRDEFSLPDDISVMRVAANRDVFSFRKPEDDAERDWEDVRCVLDRALDEFLGMREAEGCRLAEDMRQKLTAIRERTALIERLSAAEADGYTDKLTQRIKQLLGDNNIEINEQRILTEVAIFADKSSIDEEIVRLRSHLVSYEEILAETEPVGRKLDFLIQEMNRETNTIGSKSQNSEIAHLVVDMKCDIEKLREQIQNIE